MAEQVFFVDSSNKPVYWTSTTGNSVFWSDGHTTSYTASSFPPSSPTCLTKVLPSYLYVQYNDDSDLQAFVAAYNSATQSYVSWFNNINLPIYTQLTGALLDWVAQGLYGFTRPSLPTGLTNAVGAINTIVTNTHPYNYSKRATYTSFYVTTDDVFQRILTWNFFKGDGFQFSIPWLKKRVMRFLYGTAGAPLAFQQTYDVSVTFPSLGHCTIHIAPLSGQIPATAPYLKSAVVSGAVNLPFQYSFAVTY